MGSNVHVEWVSRGRFVGTDGHKHSIVMSTQDAENGIGMKPSELLLVALGGCSSIDVVSILHRVLGAILG
jgi:putative redox protein